MTDHQHDTSDQDPSAPASALAPSRRRGSVLMAAAFLGFVLLAAAVFVLSERQAAKMNVGFPAFADSPFTLRDQSGAERTNTDFAGAPIALFFGYTYCPDVCPMTLSMLANNLDDVSERGIDTSALQILFVTVDDERDTPDQLAAYLSLFDVPVTGLTGDAAALKAARGAFGAYAKRVEGEDGLVLWDHSSAVFLYEANGKFTGTLTFDEPVEFSIEKLARLLTR